MQVKYWPNTGQMVEYWSNGQILVKRSNTGQMVHQLPAADAVGRGAGVAGRAGIAGRAGVGEGGPASLATGCGRLRPSLLRLAYTRTHANAPSFKYMYTFTT